MNMNEEYEREINQYLLSEEENPRTAEVNMTTTPEGDLFYYSIDIIEDVVDYGDDGAFKEVNVDSITMVLTCEEQDKKKMKQIIKAIIDTYGFLEGGIEWNPKMIGDE